MSRKNTITIPEDHDPVRIDRFIASLFPELSRSTIKKLIAKNSISCDRFKALKASHKVITGDIIKITIPDPEEYRAKAENIPLDILYQDEDIAVINKDPGIIVHPAGNIVSGTLVNALLFHLKDLSGINGVLRPGIVHRLDKDTSGVMLIAKNDKSHRHLAEQFESRTTTKMYLSLVWGTLTKREGVIKRAIARSKSDRTIMVSGTRGRKSETRYSVREEFTYLSLLEIYPKTGRTHQIRTHFASIGHPVFGDAVYRGRNGRLTSLTTANRTEAQRLLKLMPRQALHASEISFLHPSDNRDMRITAPVPDDIAGIIDIVRSSAEI